MIVWGVTQVAAAHMIPRKSSPRCSNPTLNKHVAKQGVATLYCHKIGVFYPDQNMLSTQNRENMLVLSLKLQVIMSHVRIPHDTHYPAHPCVAPQPTSEASIEIVLLDVIISMAMPVNRLAEL